MVDCGWLANRVATAGDDAGHGLHRLSGSRKNGRGRWWPPARCRNQRCVDAGGRKDHGPRAGGGSSSGAPGRSLPCLTEFPVGRLLGLVRAQFPVSGRAEVSSPAARLKWSWPAGIGASGGIRTERWRGSARRPNPNRPIQAAQSAAKVRLKARSDRRGRNGNYRCPLATAWPKRKPDPLARLLAAARGIRLWTFSRLRLGISSPAGSKNV